MRLLICNQHPRVNLGGSEIQCDHIADHLARRGHDVTYGAFCTDEVPGQHPYRIEPIADVTYRSVLDLLRKTEPDIMYWRYNRNLFFRIASTCKIMGIRSVFSISNIHDTHRWPVGTPVSEPSLSPQRAKNALKRRAQQLVGRASYEGYRIFDGVISLSKDLLQRVPDYPAGPRFRSTIYNSMIDRNVEPFEWPRPYVAWVANLKRPKNPEQFIEAGARLQTMGVDFLLIGHIQHEQQYAYVRNPDRLPPNVHYLGPRPVSEVDSILAGALCLAHTCEPEGFGNNFIQAWLQHTPTVTLYFDPDSIIENQRLGFSSKTFEQFVRDIQILIENPGMRREMGDRARAYAKERFNPERNTRKFEAFFEKVITESQERSPLPIPLPTRR